MRADFEAIFEEGGPREQMESMALAYYRTLFRDDEYSLLWGEAKLQAARDAKFRVRFNQFLHGKRLQMAEFIQRFAERAGTPLLLPADTLAFGLMCLCDGVQSYYTADPQHVSADAAEAVLAGFFARVVLVASRAERSGGRRAGLGCGTAAPGAAHLVRQRSPVMRRYASSSDVL